MYIEVYQIHNILEKGERAHRLKSYTQNKKNVDSIPYDTTRYLP